MEAIDKVTPTQHLWYKDLYAQRCENRKITRDQNIQLLDVSIYVLF